MFRELCLCVLLLNNFYYDINLNTVCWAHVSKRHTLMSNVFGTLHRYMKRIFHGPEPKNELEALPYPDTRLVRFYETFNIPQNDQDRANQETQDLSNSEMKYAYYGIKHYSTPFPYKEETTRKLRLVMPASAELNATELITSLGFYPETHSVITSDGYVLTLHRIVPESENPPGSAVILHHGLLGSSEDWLLLGPGLALPYLLADKGYDVWLLNARGNKYSRAHSTWYTESYDFWDFSWHEMGVYDLPATISYINGHTKVADLYFIGHSMGASALFALLATLPEYNNVLKSAFVLAPLSFMFNAKGPLKQLAEIRRRKGIAALNFLGTNEFLPSGSFPPHITEKFCKGSERSCANPLLLIANGGELVDDDLIDNILTHVPSGGSAMTILHYIQLIKSGHFQMYDFGVQDNFRKYKRKYAPRYDLSSITLPITLFTSPSDWLSSDSDVNKLISKLGNVYIHHVVRRDDFNHMDFIWAKDAPELVFSVLLEILEQVSPMKDSKTKRMNDILSTTNDITLTTEED